MFAKKPSVALKSILCTTVGDTASATLSTDLSVLRDEQSGRLIMTPLEVILKLTKLDMVALSPDPTLPLEAPFPWLGLIRPTPTSSVPMIFGQITQAIMEEALRRTPNYKVAVPDGVLGLVI